MDAYSPNMVVIGLLMVSLYPYMIFDDWLPMLKGQTHQIRPGTDVIFTATTSLQHKG
jgi:hypothetical protein